jgi:hypothetical protein
MAIRMTDMMPCVTFFSTGRIFFGIVAVFMQVSLVFWPQAAAWARRYREVDGVDRLLAEFADAHRVQADPYALPQKRFRQVA